jgi:hypothetical protein
MSKFSNLDRRLKQLPLAMLLLAFAVFGWGLHYKLTLYEQAAPVQASEPAAKLLSERERGPAKANPAAAESAKPLLDAVHVIPAVMVLIPKLICSSRFRVFAEKRKAFSVLFEKSLFIRPPPAALFLS